MLVMPRNILLIFSLVLFSGIADAEMLITGRVTHVKDGDTVEFFPLPGGRPFTCELYGIDAPEIPRRGQPGQPFGLEAMFELQQLVSNQPLEAIIFRRTPDKNPLCLINKNNTNINLEMVKRGYAWVRRVQGQYFQGLYSGEFISAEVQAKVRRIGLWQDINPQPPWEYRKWGRL